MTALFHPFVTRLLPRRNALLIATAVLLIQTSGFGAKAGKAGSENEENIFTNANVLHIQVEIPEAGLRVLRETEGMRWGGGQQAERPETKCIVREGGKEYKDVAIHLKGAAGSFRPVDDNPALTLNFDKHVKGQRFRGLERISLNNSVQDRSFISEQLCREMFAQAGVPVPRATQVHLELNGRKLGIYVLVEAFNKQFLSRHFKSNKGNLYDGGFLKDITDDLQKSSGANPEDRSDLKRLAKACEEPDLNLRLAKMREVLDVDRFMTFLALDSMLCNWDGYGINKNNYRIYNDPSTGRFVFMPHGLDQMFGVMRAGPDMPVFPRMEGLVARAALNTPEGRKLYRQQVESLTTNVFKLAELTNRVWQIAARIRPTLERMDANALRRQESEASELCERIEARHANILEQLRTPSGTLQFDPSGIAILTNWQHRIDYGKPVVEELKDSGGRQLLRIAAPSGSAVGSWFTRLKLEPGRYRFEGRMKSTGVVPDPGDRKAGAGLRVTGRTFESKTPPDQDWTTVAYEFEVRGGDGPGGFMGPISDATPTLELSCHLRAAKGEALFERGSLRLIRK